MAVATSLCTKDHVANDPKWSISGALTSGETPQTFYLRQPSYRIGRRREMDLAVSSAVVSGAHCELMLSAGSLYIRDLGSTNGTFVNGHRIGHDTLLLPGDFIEIGDVCFEVMRSDQNNGGARTDPVVSKTCFVDNAHDLVARRSLTQLLNHGGVLPCFQAIHCLKTGFVRGYEFLARSDFPGVETAGELFEQARKAGREVELSLLCRRDAMRFASMLEPGIPVFLNTHPLEPLLDVVVPQLTELRKEYPDRAIVLEIHEAAITEPGLIRKVRSQLAEQGIRLAFDDFGRGQARIRELICATSDFIKFDSALIRDLQDVSDDQFRFFASIVHGIQRDGAIVVAEGVETEDMARVCRDVGFDLVQGYLYSRPTILS
ncbi:MAG: EAL domain-containing protein [Planctomycetaceae bacterium]|nr:EAL domain-containing protein [Planctomycetaceae bacterium]